MHERVSVDHFQGCREVVGRLFRLSPARLVCRSEQDRTQSLPATHHTMANCTEDLGFKRGLALLKSDDRTLKRSLHRAALPIEISVQAGER
jgi:hypothetical protein